MKKKRTFAEEFDLIQQEIEIMVEEIVKERIAQDLK